MLYVGIGCGILALLLIVSIVLAAKRRLNRVYIRIPTHLETIKDPSSKIDEKIQSKFLRQKFNRQKFLRTIQSTRLKTVMNVTKFL